MLLMTSIGRQSNSIQKDKTIQEWAIFLQQYQEDRDTIFQSSLTLIIIHTCSRKKEIIKHSIDDSGSWVVLLVSLFTHFHSFIAFASYQFTKAYYPFGIIIRRSIPTTPIKQAGYYGPILAFYGYIWWMTKEYPRSTRLDLTCDSENWVNLFI